MKQKLIMSLGLLLLVFCMQAQPTTEPQTDEISVINEENGQDDWQNVTSCSNDKTVDFNEKIANIKEKDARGFGITIIAMTVVFCALFLFFIIGKTIDSTAFSLSLLRIMRKLGVTKGQARGIAGQSGEVYAAIAIAIYEATECHDEENTILTIKNAARHYSPWSSKIYTLREMPVRKLRS